MAMDPRVHRELKALIESGMLSGLAMAIHIMQGSTAEKEMEKLDTQVAAMIGRAYMDGKLPRDGG